MKIERIKIEAGATKPFSVLFVADAHMTYTDSYDTDEHIALEKERTQVFIEEGNYPSKTPKEYFEEAIQFAEKENAILVVGGDMFDIQTHGNIEMFKKIIEGHEILFTPGGHEQQRACVRVMTEPDNFAKKSREKLQKMLQKFDLDFTSKTVNGVTLFLADNSLDYYNHRTVLNFKRKLAENLPMIVFSHDPLTDEYLLCKEGCRYDTVSEEEYSESLEMIDLLQKEENIKAFVCGHNHIRENGLLENGNPHIIASGLFKGDAILLEIS